MKTTTITDDTGKVILTLESYFSKGSLFSGSCGETYRTKQVSLQEHRINNECSLVCCWDYSRPRGQWIFLNTSS